MDNKRQTRSMTAHSRKSHKSKKRQTLKRRNPSLPKTPKILKMPKQIRTVQLSDQASSVIVKPPISLKNKLIKLKKMGEQKGIVSYEASNMISIISFIMLMKKHGSRCIVNNLGGKFSVGINVRTRIDTHNIRRVNNIHQPFIASELGMFLKNCISRGVSVICIPVDIEFEDGGGDHINMLIYRPFQKIVERFEPHGSGETLNAFDSTNNINNWINQQLKTFWEVNLTKWIGNVTYVPSDVICPRIRGLQSLENELEFIDKEGGGFCAMWAIFMAEMAMLNPEKTTTSILNEIFAITKSDPFFVKSIIRGYVLEIERELDLLLKQMGKIGFTYDHTHPYDQLFDTPDVEEHRLDRWIINTLHSQHK